MLDALAAGTPIVAVPIAFEQSATAARLAWCGAGLAVLPARARGRLAGTLAHVLAEPAFRVAARRIAATMAYDGAADAARRISAALSAPGGAAPAAGATTGFPG